MASLNRPLMRLADLAAGIYYRKSRLGAVVPAEGPVLLVGNHPNGLIDAVFLAAATPRPVRLLGKAPLFDVPVLSSVLRAVGMLPVYRTRDGYDTADNARTFELVYDALERGEVVALFPEGTTHGEPRLAALKTGAARMALGAEARTGFRLGVQVIPVGLAFHAKRRFRSRAATWIGAPVPLADLNHLHDNDPREAVRQLTARIAEGLTDVTIGVDRWEDLPLIELAERVWRPIEGRRVERIKRLSDAVQVLRVRKPRALAALADDLGAYQERLARLDLDPDDVRVRYTRAGVARFALLRLLPALFLAPVGLTGLALWWIPWRASPSLARLGRPDAETLATMRVLAGLVAFPLWWLVLLSVFVLTLAAPVGCLIGLAAPGWGVIGLAWSEERRRVAEDVAVFMRLGSRHRLREKLEEQRLRLAARIEELLSASAVG